MDARLQAREGQGQRSVPVKGELRGCREARGGGGVSGDEYQPGILDALGAPLEVVRRGGGLAVLVGAQERDVEVVARVGEVIGLAAEKSDAGLGSEHQPQIGVLLVAVEIEALARVELDDGASAAGFAGAGSLDAGDGGVALLKRPGGLDAILGRVGHLAGDVLHAGEDVGFQIRALELLLAGGGVEAVLDVIVLG